MEYCAGDDDTDNNDLGFSLQQVFVLQLPANMEKFSSPYNDERPFTESK